MVRQVDDLVNIQYVMKLLEDHLPDSAVIFGIVKNLFEARFQLYKLWVDDYPLVSTAIVVPDNQKAKLYYKNQVFVFGNNPEALHSMLDDPAIIDWDSQFIFNGLPRTTHEILNSYVTRRFGHSFDTTQPDIMYTSSDTIKIRQFSQPDNVREGTMSVKAADKANSLGVYEGEGSYEYFRDLVNSNQISVCLYHPETDAPLGWAIQHMNGELGNLHVDEKYRRQGFGKYIMSKLAKMAIEKDGYAFVFVESENIVSQTLQQTIGLRRVLNDGYIWQKYGKK